MWPRDEQRAAQALDRYLQGERVTTIAASFNLSPSTVRRWINDQLSQIASDDKTARVEQLQAAIETQRATAHEAWAAYHREVARLETLSEQDMPHRPYIHAHTYLRLALIAQREVARLQGLYTRKDAPPSDPIQITITKRLPGPENTPPPGYNPDLPTPTRPPQPTYELAQTAQLAQLTPPEARSAEKLLAPQGEGFGVRLPAGFGVRPPAGFGVKPGASLRPP